MAVERINYQAGNKACTGALVYDERASGPRPLLLMAPNWLGVTDDAIKRAATMAGSKYVAFVADMYGGGKIAAGPPEAMPLANALRADTPERRRRITAALETLRSESAKRKIGDLKRQVAVGFCFGGGNVLELARTGLATSRPPFASCTARKIRWYPKKTATLSKWKWKRRAPNGKCWFSAACCIHSAKSNPTSPESPASIPAPRASATP